MRKPPRRASVGVLLAGTPVLVLVTILFIANWQIGLLVTGMLIGMAMLIIGLAILMDL